LDASSNISASHAASILRSFEVTVFYTNLLFKSTYLLYIVSLASRFITLVILFHIRSFLPLPGGTAIHHVCWLVGWLVCLFINIQSLATMAGGQQCVGHRCVCLAVIVPYEQFL